MRSVRVTEVMLWTAANRRSDTLPRLRVLVLRRCGLRPTVARIH